MQQFFLKPRQYERERRIIEDIRRLQEAGKPVPQAMLDKAVAKYPDDFYQR